MPPSAAKLRRETVEGLMKSVNEEVARLPAGVLRKLAPALVQAEKELEKDLRKWLGNVPDGRTRFTAQQYRNALVQLRSAFEAIKEVRPEMYAGLRRGAVTAGELSTRHIATELAQFAARFGDSLNPIPLVQAASVVQHTLLDRYKNVTGRWSDRQISDIKRKLAVGLLKNEDFYKLTRRLLGGKGLRFTDDHPVADRAGAIARRLGRKQEYEAERIVRTEVINAYNVVKEEQIRGLAKGDKGFLKRWDAALDKRTCDACKALEKVGPIAVDKEFETGVSAPPLHPFCRCAVVTWHEDWG